MLVAINHKNVNEEIVKLIKDKVIELDIEFMDEQDIQTLLDAGVNEYEDVNLGTSNLSDW